MGKKQSSSSTAAKKAQKQLKQENKQMKSKLKELGEENIDIIVQQIHQQQAKRDELLEDKVNINVLSHPPSPRSASTFVSNPLKPKELVIFGGENTLSNNHTETYNNLYLYNTEKNEWKEVIAPHTPTPRSSHQAVVINKDETSNMYIFGGEYQSTSGEQFKHFADLYTLNLSTYEWTLLSSSSSKQKSSKESKSSSSSNGTTNRSPSARSGHRMMAYNNRQIILFGGFNDSGREILYYHDLYTYDTLSNEWTQHHPSSSSSAWPSPRSGYCLAVDEINHHAYIYGGVTIMKPEKQASQLLKKIKSSSSHLDTMKSITLNDMWQLNLQSMSFGNVKKQGLYPSLRSGMSSCTVRTRGWMLLFGGVADDDSSEGGERKKSYINTTKSAQTQQLQKRAKHSHDVDDDEDDGSGSDSEMDEENDIKLYNDLFVFDFKQKQFYVVDVKGIQSYPDDAAVHTMQKKKEQALKRQQAAAAAKKVAGDDDGKDNDHDQYADGDSIFDFNPLVESLSATSSQYPAATSSSTSASTSIVTSVPYPRRSAMMVSRGNEIYLYGGVEEVSGERDFTLNDMWLLDIHSGAREWKSLISMDDHDAALAALRNASDDDDSGSEDDNDEAEKR